MAQTVAQRRAMFAKQNSCSIIWNRKLNLTERREILREEFIDDRNQSVSRAIERISPIALPFKEANEEAVKKLSKKDFSELNDDLDHEESEQLCNTLNRIF